MSGVYARNRNLSQYEFYNTAYLLWYKVIDYASVSIPKSHRLFFGNLLRNDAHEIIKNVIKSDSFYPNTEHGVTYRKHYLNLAIAACDTLITDLDGLISTKSIKPNATVSIVTMAKDEIDYLKGARDGVKLI